MSKKTSVINIIITVLYNINMIQYNMRVINITCKTLYSVLVNKCSRQLATVSLRLIRVKQPTPSKLSIACHVLAYMSSRRLCFLT